jgi:hypothetical protein
VINTIGHFFYALFFIGICNIRNIDLFFSVYLLSVATKGCFEYFFYNFFWLKKSVIIPIKMVAFMEWAD